MVLIDFNCVVFKHMNMHIKCDLKVFKIMFKIKRSNMFNLLTGRIFTVFGHLEDRVLHKEACVGKLLGTHLTIQVHKKVKFSRRDSLLKG